MDKQGSSHIRSWVGLAHIRPDKVKKYVLLTFCKGIYWNKDFPLSFYYVTTSLIKRCLKCFKYQGEKPPPMAPERNAMFRIELPVAPRDGETFQTLIDEYFRVQDEQKKEMVQCPTAGCTSRVGKFTEIKLLDAQSAIVFYVNRLQFNPMWANPAFRDMTPAEQANYYAVMNYRPIVLANVIKVPFFGGGNVLYKLMGAVEHRCILNNICLAKICYRT